MAQVDANSDDISSSEDGSIDQYLDEGASRMNRLNWDASAMFIGMVSLGYERKLGRARIEVGGEYQLPYFIHHVFGVFDPELSYFPKEEITDGFGFYILPKYELIEFFQDYFWIGLLYRQRNFGFENNADLTQRDYAFMAGSEFYLTRQLSFSYWGGLGLRTYQSDDATTAVSENSAIGPWSAKLTYKF